MLVQSYISYVHCLSFGTGMDRAFGSSCNTPDKLRPEIKRYFLLL